LNSTVSVPPNKFDSSVELKDQESKVKDQEASPDKDTGEKDKPDSRKKTILNKFIDFMKF
jgi:hypothetical protein